MPEASDRTGIFRSEIIDEAAVVFGQIGYDEKCFEDVYRVACRDIDGMPSKADSMQLARSAFKEVAERETRLFIASGAHTPHRIWITFDALQEAWPSTSRYGRSSVLAVLADDQISCPAIVEEAQGVASDWAERLAGQLRMIPSLRFCRNAQVQLLACELVAAIVSGYRLGMTYGNPLHFHRVLDHWRRQLASATPFQPE